jgi:hypothetical protein
MTEQPKTPLFSVTIHAWRMRDGQSEVNIQSFVVLLTEAADIEQVAISQAHVAYPSSEEWTDQQAIWAEIPQNSQIGPFRLRWYAEVVDNDTTAGAES